MNLDVLAREAVERARSEGLLRSLRPTEKNTGRHLWRDGVRYLNFCSNNYLGLAQDPRLADAATQAWEHWGAGACASPLVCGYTAVAEELEQVLAKWKGKEEALLYSSGYAANVGTLGTLAREGDAIYSDALNHASLIDACRLSRARVEVYPHRDVTALEVMLKHRPAHGAAWVVSDSVFSMDGDLAPLPDLVAVCRRYGAFLYVDDAHGTGVFGPTGAGVPELFGVAEEVDVSMGTLSKALGSQGGFVAVSAAVKAWLVNGSRSLIYGTALAPTSAAAALEAVRICREDATLRETVNSLANSLRRELQALGFESTSQSPILPVILGSNEAALETAGLLAAEGFLVPAIRYPSVPKGTARLRITPTARHTEEDIHALVQMLTRISRQIRYEAPRNPSDARSGSPFF